MSDFKETIEDIEKADKEDKIARKLEKLREKQERKKDKKNKEYSQAATTTQANMPKVQPIEVGTSVKLKGQSSIGEVLEINGKNATVMFGMIKTTVKIDRLERSNISPSAAQK